jgi:hypothetical protein
LQRDRIVIEIQTRINTIKIANGHPFDINYVFRNPPDEPSSDLMPLTNIFEFPSETVDTAPSRGARAKPIYKQDFRVVLEHWYLSTEAGLASKDIMNYLKAAREVIFSDGQILGGLADLVVEEEVSRVYRPPVDKKSVGIGQVLFIKFKEDFNNL